MESIGHEIKMLLLFCFGCPTENVRLFHTIETGILRFDCLMTQRIVLYISMAGLSWACSFQRRDKSTSLQVMHAKDMQWIASSDVGWWCNANSHFCVTSAGISRKCNVIRHAFTKRSAICVLEVCRAALMFLNACFCGLEIQRNWEHGNACGIVMREDDLVVAEQIKMFLLLLALYNIGKFGSNQIGSSGRQVIVRQNPLVNCISCKLCQPLAIPSDCDASIR